MHAVTSVSKHAQFGKRGLVNTVGQLQVRIALDYFHLVGGQQVRTLALFLARIDFVVIQERMAAHFQWHVQNVANDGR